MKLFSLIGITFFSLFVWQASGNYFINITPSIPYGVWQKIDKSSYELGDYIVFCPTDDQLKFYKKKFAAGHCPNGYMSILKKITMKHEDFYYVIGFHPQSFDSRIFGEIKKEQIRAVVKPLFTW